MAMGRLFMDFSLQKLLTGINGLPFIRIARRKRIGDLR
jgi:hypothetical protein